MAAPAPIPSLHTRKARFDLSGVRTFLVAVLNITPDSFSDGGSFLDREAAIAHGRRLAAEGADVIDIGGESTRPGAEPVAAAVEIDRVVPVIQALARDLAVPISVDTVKAEVAEAALAAGAEIVNDVSGGAIDPAILEVCARRGAPLVVGHLRGTPATMQREIHFQDVVAEVGAELAASIARARAAGVEQLVADPGLGFGKSAAQSVSLLAAAGSIATRLGVAVMVGPSRKSFLGVVTGRPAADRLAATIAAATIAALAGARFVRAHDVAAVRDALAIADAVRAAQGPPR